MSTSIGFVDQAKSSYHSYGLEDIQWKQVMMLDAKLSEKQQAVMWQLFIS